MQLDGEVKADERHGEVIAVKQSAKRKERTSTLAPRTSGIVLTGVAKEQKGRRGPRAGARKKTATRKARARSEKA